MGVGFGIWCVCWGGGGGQLYFTAKADHGNLVLQWWDTCSHALTNLKRLVTVE